MASTTTDRNAGKYPGIPAWIDVEAFEEFDEREIEGRRYLGRQGMALAAQIAVWATAAFHVRDGATVAAELEMADHLRDAIDEAFGLTDIDAAVELIHDVYQLFASSGEEAFDEFEKRHDEVLTGLGQEHISAQGGIVSETGRATETTEPCGPVTTQVVTGPSFDKRPSTVDPSRVVEEIICRRLVVVDDGNRERIILATNALGDQEANIRVVDRHHEAKVEIVACTSCGDGAAGMWVNEGRHEIRIGGSDIAIDDDIVQVWPTT